MNSLTFIPLNIYMFITHEFDPKEPEQKDHGMSCGIIVLCANIRGAGFDIAGTSKTCSYSFLLLQNVVVLKI